MRPYTSSYNVSKNIQRSILLFSTMKPFQKMVYEIVRNIPKGSVLTYKQVAERAGKPKAFRAVGNILNKNFDSSIPCHRVVRSDGKFGGYNRGEDQKAAILQSEGIVPKKMSAILKDQKA